MRASSSTSPPARPALWADEVRARWAVAALSALMAWALYVACIAPTVTYDGDCGELIAASFRLGIAHPSGYPFFCLLGRLWASIIPFGEVGWRFNLLSATLGALSVGLVAATSHRLLWDDSSPRRSAWASGGAALLLAGFLYYGSQSLIAEVYSLNAFFLALLLWHAVSWLHSGDWRHFHTLALSFGLSLTAHLSGLFLGPALLGIAIIAPRQRFAPFRALGSKRLGVALLLCAAGFALTTYLPLRSRLWTPTDLSGGDLSRFWPLDWGHPADFASWKAHITARQYNSLLFKPRHIELLGHAFSMPGFEQPLSLWPRKVARLLDMMALQLLAATPFVPLGLGVALVAAKSARRARRALASTYEASARIRGQVAGWLLVVWALNVGIQINYDVNDIVNFFFPAYIAQAIWMAMGLDAASRWLSARSASREPLVRWRIHTLARLALVGAVVVQWIFFFSLGSYRGETRARDRALESAASLELLAQKSGARPVAFIYSNDALWSFWYARYVLNRAPETETPWGVMGSQNIKQEPQDALVARVKRLRRAPVVVAQWDDALDKRFPLQLLPGSTSLCLASDRALPAPAALATADYVASTRLDSPIRSARLRRTAITRVPWERTLRDFGEPLQKMDGAVTADARRNGVPALKRGDLAAVDVDFARPDWPAMQQAQAEGAAHIGWLQVLAIGVGTFVGAPPSREIKQFKSFAEMPFIHTTDPQIAAWTQSRRLIVPLGSKAGTPLRASFALDIDADATDGLFEIWARLVRDKKDARTPWQRVDLVQLSHR